jgi:hypothetical protein
MTGSALLMRVLKGGPRHAVVALPALLGLAVFAAEGTAQEQEEQSFEAEVQTNGDTIFCAAGAQEECTDAGRDVVGTLRVRVASPEGSADVAVGQCPEERSGVVVTLSRTSPGTNVCTSLTGEAQSDGETQQVEESVGPVGSDRSGEATVLVCGSDGPRRRRPEPGSAGPVGPALPARPRSARPRRG